MYWLLFYCFYVGLSTPLFASSVAYKLRKQAKHLSEELFLLFPIETSKEEKSLFDLLKRGYIDARYKADHVITQEELTRLIERVQQMQIIVDRICREKIASFTAIV